MVNPPETDEGAEERSIPHLLRLILQELQTDAQESAREHGQPWHQNTAAQHVNATFFLFYLISISLFLLVLFLDWMYW